MATRTLQTSAKQDGAGQLELFDRDELGRTWRLMRTAEAEAFIARCFRELREHFERELEGQAKRARRVQ